MSLDAIRSRPTVNIGNVAEFNEQFFDAAFSTDHIESWRSESNHYACLATLYSAEPSAVVVPLPTSTEWIDLQRHRFEWDRFPIHSGFDGLLCESVALDQRTIAALRGVDGDLVCWGVSDQFVTLSNLLGRSRGHSSLASLRHAESKVESAGLLRRAALHLKGRVGVVDRLVSSEPREVIDSLVVRSRAGQTSVLKSEYGVGGFGARVIHASEIAGSQVVAKQLLSDLIEDDNIYGNGRWVVEDFVPGRAKRRDLTVDAVVHESWTEFCGIGDMIVKGTKYIGVDVGPSAVSAEDEAVMRSFVGHVGEELRLLGCLGWFDIDFVADVDGTLFATEINARRTGPTIAYSIRDRCRHLEPLCDFAVRTIDLIDLPRRLAEDELFKFLGRLRVDVARSTSIDLIPTLFTASQEETPYFGIALILRLSDDSVVASKALDLAEKHVRAETAALTG